MDIKLKNIKGKVPTYCIYILLVIMLSVTFLSALELKQNWRYLRTSDIYTDTQLTEYINEYTNMAIDYALYYKNPIYTKDDNNITQDDIDICKTEIRNKIEDEYNNYRDQQYSYNSFHNLTSEQQQKVFDEERKRIQDKYTLSEEAFLQYVLNRKINSENALRNKLAAYNNIRYGAYDKINNMWIGDNNAKSDTLITNTKYLLKKDINTNGRENTTLYIKGKATNDTRVLSRIPSYNDKYDYKHQEKDISYSYTQEMIITKNIMNNSNHDITVYVWIPTEIVGGDNIATAFISIKGNINRFALVAIIFALSFIVSLVLLKKVIAILKGDEKLNNLIERIRIWPIELYLISVVVIWMGWLMTATGMYYNDGYIKRLYLGAIVSAALLIIVICLVGRIIYLNYKDDVLFKNNITTIVIKTVGDISRRESIFQSIFVILTIYVISAGALFILAIVFYELFPIFLIAGIVMTAILIGILIRNLLYLDKIMIGAKDGAEGRLTYKIDEKGTGHLKELAHNINNIKEGLKTSIQKEVKSEKMKTELITNVSHDLKTPLTSIINYIDLLKREEIQPEAARDYINVLDNKSQRLKLLIEDLFEASKAASGAMELNLDRIDLVQLLKQALGENDEKLQEMNLNLRTNIPEEKIFIKADGKRVYRVLENLISNISKYSLRNTRVYVDVIKTDEEVQIVMRNISSYELNFDAEEITERFKRGDEARSTEGSGLGLAIAKSIMELHGGEFNIETDGDLFKSITTFKL